MTVRSWRPVSVACPWASRPHAPTPKGPEPHWQTRNGQGRSARPQRPGREQPGRERGGIAAAWRRPSRFVRSPGALCRPARRTRPSARPAPPRQPPAAVPGCRRACGATSCRRVLVQLDPGREVERMQPSAGQDAAQLLYARLVPDRRVGIGRVPGSSGWIAACRNRPAARPALNRPGGVILAATSRIAAAALPARNEQSLAALQPPPTRTGSQPGSRSRTPGPMSSAAINRTPAPSKAATIWRCVPRCNPWRPASKSRTVLRDTPAHSAKASWVQSSNPRAARH